MTTIKDVAQRAGVSIATVSHVISGKRYVSEELTEKVKKAIADLNYHPSAVARSMVVKNTRTVGLVIPNIASPFFTTVTKAVEDTLSQYGYNVVLCNTDDSIKKEHIALEMLKERRVDGIIIAPADPSGKKLFYNGVPVVVIDRKIGDIVDTVLVNNQTVSHKAVDYLIKLGHKRIAIILGNLNLDTIQDRLNGYIDAHKKHGLEIEDSLIVETKLDQEGGIEAAQRIIRQDHPPTAVFVTNDLLTIGLFIGFKKSRVKIPEDISVIGFDDFGLAPVVEPPLTVVAQPMRELGISAVKLLTKRMSKKEKQKPEKIILNAELVYRRSCSPPLLKKI